MDRRTVLIVDDNPDIRLGLHLRLKANHYETLFAADALSGVAEARKHQPDLIILDLGLPAGDGFLVIERLRIVPALALIPIIIVSGRTGVPNRERALEAGVKAFLEKPVDNAELLAVIRKTLGGPVELERPAHLSKPVRRLLL